MASRKDIWAGMDRLEGKREGSSHEHLEKERVRQGYKSDSKSKAIHNKTEGKEHGEKKEKGWPMTRHDDGKTYGSPYKK